MNYDAYRKSQQILTREAQGVLDLFESLRGLFAMTTFGGILAEPVKYAGESATVWEDPEKGIVHREISFLTVWYIELPTTATTTDADLIMPTTT